MKYQTHGTGFQIPMRKGGGFTIVPNKQAAGILSTRQRHADKSLHANDALRLSRFGTLDKLAKITPRSIPTACPCCGNKTRNKVTLNPMFRAKLSLMRYARDHKEEAHNPVVFKF